MLAIMLALLVSSAALVWRVDPLQLFRSAAFYPAIVSANERAQNAGLLRNYPGENLIIGSSLAQSCRSDDFEAALGGKFLRLSAAGLTAKELGFFLDQRLNRSETSKVYHFSYWFTFARSGSTSYREEYGEFPEHLYLFGPTERVKYLLNVDNMIQSIDILLEIAGFRTIDRIPFIDRNSGEQDPNRVTGSASVAKVYQQIANGAKPSNEFLAVERARMERAFADYYEPVVAAHPGVEFEVILPPFSVAYYKAFERAGVYRRNTILKFRRLLINLAAKYPNVTLHDYSADFGTVTNYDLFFDTHHFNREACAAVASGIAKKPEGDSAETVLENERRLKRWADEAVPPAG